jgi:hypothetical protein
MQRPLPTTAQPRLAGPAATAESISRGLHALKAAREKFATPFNERPLAERAQWALDLQDAEKRGEPLTDLQRQAWRTALQVLPLETIPGEMRGVAEHLRPASMRSGADLPPPASYEGDVP